jgi:hypothetical protein
MRGREIVKNAQVEIGYVEKSGNETKYGEWFGLNGTPWCGIFVSWVYATAGYMLPKIGWMKGYAGCQYAYEYFKKVGWITSSPSPGDIVLYDFNGDGRYDHTGIFCMWNKQVGKFTAIEGNTSVGNNTNGGMVMKRIRSDKRAVFVHVPDDFKRV